MLLRAAVATAAVALAAAALAAATLAAALAAAALAAATFAAAAIPTASVATARAFSDSNRCLRGWRWHGIVNRPSGLPRTAGGTPSALL